MKVLGIDVGGTGIKGAPVDAGTGKLLAERFRVDTPKPATPRAIAQSIQKLILHFAWKGPIGITLPAVVQKGVVCSAANIDRGWIGLNAEQFLGKLLKQPVVVLNDADAAGLAEATFGAGKGVKGLVMLVTLGTGIGSALVFDGKLIPNSELGHLIIRGKDAEHRASNRVREERDLSWKKWSKRVGEYLVSIENLLWPELIVIGGGVSKDAKKFLPRIDTRTKLVAAKLLNEAGIIGAALKASGR
jgi:polyphosphate glucokinase